MTYACECLSICWNIIRNWIFIKPWLIERFCLVTILKFSLFSASKNVHEVMQFSANNMSRFSRNFNFLLVYLKKNDNWPRKDKIIYVFADFENFNLIKYNFLNQKFHFNIENQSWNSNIQLSGWESHLKNFRKKLMVLILLRIFECSLK